MPRGAAVALLALLGVALFAAQADAARIFAINQSESECCRLIIDVRPLIIVKGRGSGSLCWRAQAGACQEGN